MLCCSGIGGGRRRCRHRFRPGRGGVWVDAGRCMAPRSASPTAGWVKIRGELVLRSGSEPRIAGVRGAAEGAGHASRGGLHRVAGDSQGAGSPCSGKCRGALATDCLLRLRAAGAVRVWSIAARVVGPVSRCAGYWACAAPSDCRRDCGYRAARSSHCAAPMRVVAQDARRAPCWVA